MCRTLCLISPRMRPAKQQLIRQRNCYSMAVTQRWPTCQSYLHPSRRRTSSHNNLVDGLHSPRNIVSKAAMGPLSQSMSTSRPYNEYQLHEEANEAHDNEPYGCSDGDLVEFCKSSLKRSATAAEEPSVPTNQNHRWRVVQVPRRSGLVHLLTKRTLFLAKSLRGVTTVSICDPPLSGKRCKRLSC